MIDYIKLIREGKLMKFYKSKEWRELRLKALKRDNYECQMCKSKVNTNLLRMYIILKK